MIRKEELLKAYTEQGIDAESITLMISMPTGETEVITNPNVAEKIAYIEKTYDDDLVHAGCKQIRITEYGFTFKTDGMDFGSALMNLKEGHRVARKGWNGKGIFIELQVPDEHSKMTHPYIYIDTTGLQIENPDAPKDRVPWFASQTDMLSEDWVVI